MNYRKMFLCLGIVVITCLLVSFSYAAPAKVKLIYWTNWEQNPKFNAYYAEVGQEFAKLHPECAGVDVVTIPYSGYEAKYRAALMARTGAPDIFFGTAHDWFQFVEKMPSDLAKSVDENAVNAAIKFGTYNGVRYGLPLDGGNFLMMFINTDMYQEAGLDPNKPPTTFTELLEHAKKLTKYDASGKVIRSGYGVRYAGNQTGVADKFLPFLHAFGGLMVDPKFKKGSGYANSPAGVEALQFYGDMVNKYKVSSLNVGTPETAFGQKNAAIIFREAWLTGWLRDNAPTVHYKVYPIPTQKVVAGPSALFPWVDMVYKYSPNKKLAWEYLRFMWSKEHDLKRAMSQDIMPVWKANTETDYVKSRPDYTAIVETNMRKPGVSYFTPRLNEITSIYGDAVLDVIYGRKNAKTALDEAAVKLDQILSQ